MRRLVILILLCTALFAPSAAQEDAFNLPSDLFVLLNTGQIERYGLGAAGVARVGPQDAELIDFGVAPDGIHLALRGNDALNVHNMLTGESRAVEVGTSGFPPYRGRGETVAWSPDGRVIAYTIETGIRFFFADTSTFANIDVPPVLGLIWSEDGTYLAAESEGNIWWVYRREASAMILHAAIPSSLGLAWVDRTVLMFAPAEGGLFLMDVGNANAQAQIADESTLYRHPALLPDRSVQVFGRGRTDSAITEDQGYLHTATFDASAGWSVTRTSEIPIDLGGARWTPDGRLVMVLRGGVIALVDPVSGQGFSLPATGVATYGWGAVRAFGSAGFPTTADAYFLMTDYTGRRQIWLAPRDGSPPTPITQSETDIDLFTVGADGASIAYYSAGSLYYLPPQMTTAEPLIELAVPPTAITFSADGQNILYDDGSSIFAIGLDGAGVAAQFLQGYTAPQTIQAGLLVRLPDGDLGLYDETTRNLRRLGAFRSARILGDRTIAAIGKPQGQDPEGVYLLDAEGTAPPLLLVASGTNREIADFTQTDAGILRLVIVASDGLPASVDVVEIATSGGGLNYIANLGFIADPTITGDGQFVAGLGSASGLFVVHDVPAQQAVSFQLSPEITQLSWVRLR